MMSVVWESFRSVKSAAISADFFTLSASVEEFAGIVAWRVFPVIFGGVEFVGVTRKLLLVGVVVPRRVPS